MIAANPAEPIDRFIYWLNVTGSPQLAARCANRQCGLSLSVEDFREMLKAEKRSSDSAGERHD